MSIFIQILKRKKSIIFFLITFFSVLISFSQEVTKERVGNSPEKHINATRGPGTGASILVPNDDNQHGGTPKELVENILASSCVEVVSARFCYYDKVNGNWVTNFGNNTLERQLGYFNEGAAQNFPIEEGLLLSTGEIQNAMGPSVSGNFTDEMAQNASDPDLALITNRKLFDAAVLEIDFIPVGDNIEFQFIFASDEYLEFCGTQFEDIFGFFLSGPGVSGGNGYQNDAVNLAELPNGDPITVNTIHPAVPSNYYGVPVPASNEAYYANNNYAISTEFDGGTVILTAKYLGVTSGSQYKMKLAIADASDGKWDAGMFLQAKSFSTVDAGSYGPVCVDGADITLVGSPVGGVWSGTGVTGNTFDPSVGTQTLTYTYTNTNDCTNTDDTIIEIYESPTADITSPVNVLCFGDATGEATVTVEGGTAPYTYSWDNGQTEATATGLVAGDYVVTVTDANGNATTCSATATATIEQPVAALSVSITSEIDVLCYGEANGAVDITVSGGTPGYSYLWTTIDGSGLDPNAEDQTGLTTGIYEVEITDANGCTITDTVIIDGPQSALTITITSQVNELCFGDANGEINISVSGGTTEYSYLWSNGQPTQDLFNLYPGTYSVLVTDANGCTATASATITGPDEELTSEITSQTAVLCYEDNSGEIDLTVNGGTPDYTYLWSTTDGSGLVVDAEDQTELSAGTYEVLITDENGCVTNNIVMISEAQSGLDATIISQVDMECVGSGSVIIEANGGTLPYEFTLNGVTTQNSGSFNDLAEGNNTIIVEDANGCSFTVPVFIVNKCIGLVKEVELFDDDGDNCADEGEELLYTFTVNNMGNVELTDVIITDPLVTVTGGPITLQPGEIDATTFTADYMITENDVVNIGEVVNQATAFGTTPSDENVSDLSDNENFLEDDPTVFDNFCKVIVNAPTIAIIKEAMIVDENDNGCPDIGETILYTFKVKNTSTEEELIDVIIIDPMVEVLGSPITLSIGGIDTDTFTALHTITQEDLDTTYIDNQAMAIGTGSDSQLSAEDLSHETSFTDDGFTTVYFCQPALGIELEKSGQWNDENGDGGADEGETISYTFSVINTGDEPLYNITLEDPLPGIVMEGGPIEVLMPLQTDDTSFTATYTLSQEDVDNLEVINQATVTGENNNGNSVITEVSDDPSTVEENDPTVIILPDVGGVLFEIFNGITPNGDGFNDYFQIDGIDQFSNNNVKIFNRWGILIFETNGYNESSNVFKGESNARATIEGDRDVPTGTYFYIITFPDVNPGKDSYSGYLYINR